MLGRAYRLLALLLALSMLVAVACGDDDEPAATPTAPAATATQASALSGDITVFAASSLTDAFTDIGEAFETANPDVGVEFNFAGSPALRTQLTEGAPADVIAVADQTNMQQALDAGLVVDAGESFASNQLVIIVPADNPAGIATPFDLANDGVRLVLAAEDVPAGNYARQSIDKIGQQSGAPAGYGDSVLANVVSNEPNVKAVVTKVQLGEADAGIVYVTDVTPDIEGDVSTVDIPDDVNVIAVYPVAVTTDAAEPEIAAAFIDFVLSEEGRAILSQYGFLEVQ